MAGSGYENELIFNKLLAKVKILQINFCNKKYDKLPTYVKWITDNRIYMHMESTAEKKSFIEEYRARKCYRITIAEEEI